MIWGIVAYIAVGISSFLVCMAAGSGIVSDVYNGNYPESAGAGIAAISCILMLSILAAIIWPVAFVLVIVILIIEKIMDRGGKNEI